jgi:hypothetical protein
MPYKLSLIVFAATSLALGSSGAMAGVLAPFQPVFHAPPSDAVARGSTIDPDVKPGAARSIIDPNYKPGAARGAIDSNEKPGMKPCGIIDPNCRPGG